jgi:hypothetical protein
MGTQHHLHTKKIITVSAACSLYIYTLTRFVNIYTTFNSPHNNKHINYNNQQEFDILATRLTAPEGYCAGCTRQSPLGWFEATLNQLGGNGEVQTAYFYGTCCQECHVSAVWPQTDFEQPYGKALQTALEAHTGWGRRKKGPRMNWYCPLCYLKFYKP